ncbi:HamA C-terminal domain-containing protein [Thermophagus sp. OGC60D27]|uniref:HamA C-terminal domain-containing protein n=1 Tax=Thermophagus sp. OGC60D27 TaxID=3458415 RepID=UPI0040382E2E
MIKTNINSNFLDLFHQIIEDYKLDNSNRLNVFMLKIRNNRFAYNDLVNLLGNNLYYFALSRTEIQKLIDNNQFDTLIKRTKNKFRDYTSNEGELGEVMLYCLLEAHLKAPKILTKLELKTANNDYVKGADGVHLLKLDDENYQLIFGEAKLDADLKQGIYDAFGSISKLLKDDNKKLDFEFDLVNSQLIKEVYDENQYKKLKSILLPSARAEETYLDYSFGIFLGFEAKITDEEMKLSNSDFRKKIKERIKQEVLDRISSFNHQIRKEEFTGYQFYIYILPFSDLAKKRKEIIKELTV